MTVTTRVAAFCDGARFLMPPYGYIRGQKRLQCPESGSLRRTFWACTLWGTALVYQTLAAPGLALRASILKHLTHPEPARSACGRA